MAARTYATDAAVATPGFGTLVDSWRQIIATGNLPRGRAIDGVSRWLLITFTRNKR